MEAIEERVFDIVTGKVKHPQSLVLYSLKNAIVNGLIDGQSAWFTSPGSKKVFTISEAIESAVMDSLGYWSSPLSGEPVHYVFDK